MSLAAAELWTARAIGLAVLLQTLELLQVRHVLRDDGVWRWSLLKREHCRLFPPIRSLFGLVLPYRPFLVLLVLRVPLAFAMGAGNSFVTPIVLFTQLAICVRFRGAFNGGSDSMSVLILLALSVAWAGRGVPVAVAAGFVFIAVELALSYFIAGVTKLKERDWRSGAALGAFVMEPRYSAPKWARALLSRKLVSVTVSWSVILFECTFPLALANVRLGAIFAALGLAFHLGNAVVFGLNRFLFAWAAAYPSLLLTSWIVTRASP